MVGRILRKGFNYICLSTNISIPYTKVEVCTGPYPADERGVFQWGGPGWQMRGGFSNSPGRAGKSLMSFKTPGLVSYEAQQKTLLSNPCRKIYCLLLLLLLLLLFLLLLNTFPNLHPVCSFHNSDLLIPFVTDFEYLY